MTCYPPPKKILKNKLKKYIKAMKYYHKRMPADMLKVESLRYYEDHFSYEERQYLKRHCPLIIRIRLWWLGANVL